MIRYSQLRGNIYYHELKQLLPSVGNLFAFLLSILYLAISASILTALISLSVIADINTTIEQRAIYQGGYFLLLYFLIRIQRTAILGLNYQHYLASLPVSKKLKHSNTALLTVVAGNLPLLAPLFLLTYIPNLSTFLSQVHFPIFALSILIVAWMSLKNKTFPWLSFLFTPLVLSLGFDETSLNAIIINSSWLFIIVAEAYYKPLSYIVDKAWRVKYYGQVRWIAIMKNPASVVIRIFFCGLFISMASYVQYKMGLVANSYIKILFIWVLSIVIGSYQFDNEEFYQFYPHYLKGLLNQFTIRYYLDILPALFITLLSCLAIYWWLNFSIEIIILLPLEVLLTIISVSKFRRIFFIIPSLLSGLLMYLV
jgi:hypothetical protein